MSMSAALGVWLETTKVPADTVFKAVARHAPDLVEARVKVRVHERVAPGATFVVAPLDGFDLPLQEGVFAQVAKSLAKQLGCRAWAIEGFTGTANALGVQAFDAKGKPAWTAQGEDDAPHRKFLEDVGGGPGPFFSIDVRPFLELTSDWTEVASRRLGEKAAAWNAVDASDPRVREIVGRDLRPAPAEAFLRTRRKKGRAVTEVVVQACVDTSSTAALSASITQGLPVADLRFLEENRLATGAGGNPFEWVERVQDELPEGMNWRSWVRVDGLPLVEGLARVSHYFVGFDERRWLHVIAAQAPTERELLVLRERAAAVEEGFAAP